MYRHLGEDFQDIKNDGHIVSRTAAAAVCVIDHAEETREFVATLLESDGFVVQAHRTVAEFCAETEFRPDCLLVDFDGLEATIADVLDMREKRSGCAIPVVVIGPDSVGAAVQCMKAGASDCIAKPIDEQALVACLRRMCAIGRVNRAKATDITAAKAKLDSLTEREKQVLELVIGGRSNQAVADELNISGRTAEHYRARIKTKFEAKHLVEIVHTAIIAMQSVPNPVGYQRKPASTSDKTRLGRHNRRVGATTCTHFPEQAA